MSALEDVLKTRYNGNVSQYGWIIDGKKVECSYNGCHSQILSYPGTPEVAWSMGPNIPSIRLDYLFDLETSPWRSLIPTLLSPRSEIEAGSPFVYGDLSLDANLIVNHMVSVRWPAEQIKSYDLWEELVLNRCHPAVADLIVGLIATRDQQGIPFDKDKLRYTTTQLMHSNFIALDCSMSYAENFVSGRMAGGNGNPFGKTKTSGTANDYAQSNKPRGYKPIVGAFGEYPAISFVEQLKGTKGEYMQFLVDTYGELTNVQGLVDICKAEQKRFNLDDWSPGQRYADAGIRQTPAGVELGRVKEYEQERMGRSHWNYVQTSSWNPGHAHAF